MKKALLIGCGAEIGSNLVLLSAKYNFGFIIDTIVNQPIKNDPVFPKLNQAHSIQARLELAQPIDAGVVSVLEENKILVYEKEINLIFKELNNFIEDKTKTYWDIIILATSKEHLNNSDLLNKLKAKGKYIFGMAESSIMNNFYPALLNFNSKMMNTNYINKNDRLFSLGSCQTNGWLAQFTVILDILKNIKNLSLDRIEVDIIHPETPTGRIGTKSFSPRSQDSRNNLRPSFSQIEKAMKKLLPGITSLQTVSLRVPIEEPGYQITRTFFKGDINKDFGHRFEEYFIKAASEFDTVDYTHIPLGSKAYKHRKAIAHVLPYPYLRFYENCFSTEQSIHQIITQAFISNVYAYCYQSLVAIKNIATDHK